MSGLGVVVAIFSNSDSNEGFFDFSSNVRMEFHSSSSITFFLNRDQDSYRHQFPGLLHIFPVCIFFPQNILNVVIG